MSLNLLEKTELWVSDVTLDQANLTEMAAAVARVLGLQEDKVMVVDDRHHISHLILQKKKCSKKTSWERKHSCCRH